MSILNEPRKPDCDVCDWATSSWWAHGLNLCQADFELIRKVVKTEQDRIIKLLETKHFPESSMHSNRCPICKAVALITGEADYYEEENAWLDALIKGENK